MIDLKRLHVFTSAPMDLMSNIIKISKNISSGIISNEDNPFKGISLGGVFDEGKIVPIISL
jgi:hypothetical protein